MTGSESSRQLLFDLIRVLVTVAMVALAAAGIYWVMQQQKAHPWTRDGQVLANVVHVAPQVSGPVIRVAVTDNQLVAKGDPLFEIEPAPYHQGVQLALAQLAQVQAEAKSAAADAERAQALIAHDDISQQNLVIKQALAEAQAASVDAARVELARAQLKLAETRVAAPVAGYVTNLELDVGTYATSGQPVLALIEANSFWVDGYFKEVDLPFIALGDPAVVTLMAYPNQPLNGHVQSIAFGIARRNSSIEPGDLAQVSPTFEWIRLSQRIPVRIALETLPETIPLRIGYTASVAILPSHSADQR
ncbi:hypothetical protein CKO25_04115 [Thiocapsa imhoffii]|uniref:HlyD family secretion protein n=1 Tax=Thiocapsa imhoffii TaxID=382777 RepID=A0A9X0WFQ3_9GAMM|nr:HlyD family secretion protein [Thiocapsa imhoffii]MBK1643859.1 hypothetical protein [Thiocapsa imhoffii]